MTTTISVGEELKDYYTNTDKWVQNGISFVLEMESFYRERAQIELEYLTKLKELCKRHYEAKSKYSAKVSVGDEPAITPGSLESASMVLWGQVLTQTEAISDEKASFAKELGTKIIENLSVLKSRCTGVRVSIEQINELLTNEKKEMEEEINKAKKNYDSLCQSTESSRQKVERSSSNDKYQRKLEEKQVEMNNGKNHYLIKISVANSLKDKYYFQDVPEILDYLQELNQDRVILVNKLLKNALIIERNSSDKVKDKLHQIDEVILQNEKHKDTMMFIEHNKLPWQEPSDFYFIPSSIWHDDDSLITKEPELTELKKRLNAASIDYKLKEESCLELKQQLEKETVERHQEQESLTLKFDQKFLSSLAILKKYLKEDTERVKNEAKIRIIQNYAGDKDLSYYEETKQKKSRFGLFHSRSVKSSSNGTGGDSTSIHTVATANPEQHSGIFQLRRGRTQSNASSTVSNQAAAHALYDYAAAGEDELSISKGMSLLIINPDSNGWTMVQNTEDGTSGFVPTSYIEKVMTVPITSNDTGGSLKKKGPMVAPKRGGKRVQYVEAIYDYTEDGDDEISISKGDRIILITEDLDNSGWTEGELDGRRGMFPTTYIKKI
ncbi:uncharacterized protein KQ657_004531 [Scheffersomyces spartinae]|uniref:Protein BZZ1 n=1 Tax=Scheffersomyces spartinae TaxID=45513 RepID=A0A9P7VBJ4_9ASCO|nr:uncharacterized protein KQ657_004531 [Scheffersomyces spartinae]KAG7194319.1 hypothetical protein KQ657_004531 [Scheffersomyces spartinae]